MPKHNQTSFKPGQSGNPKGRPKAEWTWSGLLKDLADELHEKTGIPKKEIIASALFKEAMKGNVHAIKEFGDRVDGKPKQSHELTGKDGKDLLPQPMLGGESNNGISRNNSDEKTPQANKED